MTLAALQDVRVLFGTQEVLRGVNLQLNERGRVGMVGRNGAGKTTILRVLTGEQAPDGGNFILQRGCTVRLLKQERAFGGSWTSESTVMDVALRARQDLLDLEARVHRLQARVEEHPEDHAALEELGHATDRFATLGGWELRARVKQVLSGLGIGERAWDQPAMSLSGGEAGRLELATLLLAQPDLLLLDEPTNHLDMDAVEFLENWLREFPGAVLVVSHDRAFLDNVATEIAEVKVGRVEMYSGGYSDYAIERELREERRLKAFEEQQAHIRKTEAWIQKNIASATSARQAQSRRKALARMQRLDAPEQDARTTRLTFPSGMRSADIVLDTRGLGHAFGERWLFKDLALTVRRGEKIGVAGPNGAGKSTLGRILAGKIAPTAGTVTTGRKVELLYFDQAQADLPRQGTAFSLVRDAATQATNEQLRGHLGRFAFSGDEAEKDVATLSGGERARLALALLTLSPANCLILDEPTNHLDLDTRESLESALEAFEGTVLLISHDRYLLDAVTDRTWVVADGGLVDEGGPWSEARARMQARAAAAMVTTEGGKVVRAETQAQAHKRAEKERRALERDLARCEARISEVETAMAAADARMADPATAWQELADAQKERAKLGSEMESLMADWERLSTALQE